MIWVYVHHIFFFSAVSVVIQKPVSHKRPFQLEALYRNMYISDFFEC